MTFRVLCWLNIVKIKPEGLLNENTMKTLKQILIVLLIIHVSSCKEKSTSEEEIVSETVTEVKNDIELSKPT